MVCASGSSDCHKAGMLPWRWRDITEWVMIVPANAKGRAIELTCSWFLVDELGSKDTDKHV